MRLGLDFDGTSDSAALTVRNAPERGGLAITRAQSMRPGAVPDHGPRAIRDDDRARRAAGGLASHAAGAHWERICAALLGTPHNAADPRAPHVRAGPDWTAFERLAVALDEGRARGV
ncbi:MAG: hypothetical protein FJ027_13390 [Candidatus Rokubacteria bacterium]|nr:hypothetical protein [Chloroflexota bacterium]MBM4441406.1 hypothetical protein [Candidatus Rokubacteria bacterium]